MCFLFVCVCVCMNAYLLKQWTFPEVAEMWYSLDFCWRSLCPSQPLRSRFSQCLSELFYAAEPFCSHSHTHAEKVHLFLGTVRQLKCSTKQSPTQTNKNLAAHYTANHHPAVFLFSCCCGCCSDIPNPPGLAQHALFQFPFHLLLLCADRTTWCCCWLPVWDYPA